MLVESINDDCFAKMIKMGGNLKEKQERNCGKICRPEENPVVSKAISGGGLVQV